jgi:hypothetical protein
MKYLITEKYIKDTCPSISTNNNGVNIAAACQMVTLRYMKKLLSTDLFQFYSDYVNAVSPTPLTSYQEELFGLVQYYMALQVERHMLTNLIDVSNKGATAEQNAASLELVTYKRQELQASILDFENEIQSYLDTNAAEFPQYKPTCEVATLSQRSRTKNPFGLSLEADKPILYK